MKDTSLDIIIMEDANYFEYDFLIHLSTGNLELVAAINLVSTIATHAWMSSEPNLGKYS